VKTGKLLLWSKKIVRARLTWFLLGFSAPIIIACTMQYYGIISDSYQTILDWGISEEENGKMLFVHPFDETFLFNVKKDPNSKTWEELSVSRFGPKKKEDFVFIYKDDGVIYGAANKLFWRDFNCDGQFDLRRVLQEKLTDIYMGDQWVKVHYDNDNKQAKTEEGMIYSFNTSSGKWEAIE